jgi:hypothetical protein
MAAPTLSGTGTGATDAGGAWSYTTSAGAAAGRLFIVGILQDGISPGVVAVTGATNIENLAGTDNQWTTLFLDQAGSGGAQLTAYIGRALSGTAPTISGTNSTSLDLYICDWSFNDVSTGTTLATVIENVTAGSIVYTSPAGGTINDADVTTLGVDRLAINIVGLDDDASGISEYTGESGGNWSVFTGFESASGTDGSIYLCTAAMATAGTISGGTETTTPTGGKVAGFALIGTTVAAADVPHEPIRALQAVNRGAVW